MKKKILLISAAIILAAALAVTLCGCSAYKPDDNEVYYESDSAYRVISLESSEPQTVQNYPLQSLVTYVEGVITNVKTSGGFAEDSMFFESNVEINHSGVEAIYRLLGINMPVSGLGIKKDCQYTNLYTFNKMANNGSMMEVEFDPSNYPRYTVVGEMADVKIYTVKYQDRSKKDGEKTGEGSFKAIVCGMPYISTFLFRQ